MKCKIGTSRGGGLREREMKRDKAEMKRGEKSKRVQRRRKT